MPRQLTADEAPRKRGARVRTLPTAVEIHSLLRLMRDLFAHYNVLKSKFPIARYIQFPKVPTALTEGLALLLINNQNLLAEIDGIKLPARCSTSGGDIVCDLVNGDGLSVEVKGTAKSAFQHFSPKDLKADLVIWVHYDTCFSDNKSSAQVVLIQKPGTFIESPRRVTLGSLRKLAGDTLRSYWVDLDSLSLIGN